MHESSEGVIERPPRRARERAYRSRHHCASGALLACACASSRAAEAVPKTINGRILRDTIGRTRAPGLCPRVRLQSEYRKLQRLLHMYSNLGQLSSSPRRYKVASACASTYPPSSHRRLSRRTSSSLYHIRDHSHHPQSPSPPVHHVFLHRFLHLRGEAAQRPPYTLYYLYLHNTSAPVHPGC